MSAWWPWSSDPEPTPTPAPALTPAPAAPEPAPSLDLATVLAEHNARWYDRAVKADQVLVDAFRRYGRWVPIDVVLDAHNILHPPPPLRPAVPVVPGREG